MLGSSDFQNASLAYDQRLDSSVNQTMENNLFVNMCIQNEIINRAVSEPLPSSLLKSAAQSEPNVEDSQFTRKSSTQLLQDTIELLFDDLSRVNIENLLTFWLSLATLDAAGQPLFHLNETTAAHLIDYLLKYPHMNVKLWYLAFRMLTVLVASSNQLDKFIQSSSLYQLVYKCISSPESLLGDECCNAFLEFLRRLTKLLPPDAEKSFKRNLFSVLCEAIDESGCIRRLQGALDAQISFVEYLSGEELVTCLDDGFINYFDCLSRLAYHHICTYPRLSLKGAISPRSCFSAVLSSLLFSTRDKFKETKNPNQAAFAPFNQFGLNSVNNSSFPSTSNSSIQASHLALKPMDTKHSILSSRDTLICILLKHAINLISNLKPSIRPKTVVEETKKEMTVFDDDLLLQQLFLYELEEGEAGLLEGSECEELPGEEIVASCNAKKARLIGLLSEDCLETFLESLGLCQSSALAMVISNSNYPVEITLEDVQTPGDGVYLLLKAISNANSSKLVSPVYNYLSKVKRLSEPLLWLFSGMFSNEPVLREFIDRGGVEVISKGLTITTRQLLYSGPCIVSSLMNLIDSERQQMKMANNSESESTEGFTNFAPFGSVSCTSATGNPVDVLVQSGTAPHRRIRSAVWSYHFQPGESKVGLYFSFPYTFLLKEIHILPHIVSFANCPAYVSVEVSRDGSFMTPVGPPVFTTGMSTIKLQLNKSELVNTVQVNLYKAKDSQMIGLSQVRSIYLIDNSTY